MALCSLICCLSSLQPHVPHLAAVQRHLQSCLWVLPWSVWSMQQTANAGLLHLPACARIWALQLILSSNCSMSWTHFLRENGISTKHFSAFWKTFSLLRASWIKNGSCPMFTTPVPEEGVFPGAHIHHWLLWCRDKHQGQPPAIMMSSGPAPRSPLHHHWEGTHAPQSAATATCWGLLCSQCPFLLLLIS